MKENYRTWDVFAVSGRAIKLLKSVFRPRLKGVVFEEEDRERLSVLREEKRA